MIAAAPLTLATVGGCLAVLLLGALVVGRTAASTRQARRRGGPSANIDLRSPAHHYPTGRKSSRAAKQELKRQKREQDKLHADFLSVLRPALAVEPKGAAGGVVDLTEHLATEIERECANYVWLNENREAALRQCVVRDLKSSKLFIEIEYDQLAQRLINIAQHNTTTTANTP